MEMLSTALHRLADVDGREALRAVDSVTALAETIRLRVASANAQTQRVEDAFALVE